jgi:anti-sigma factor RsiW
MNDREFIELLNLYVDHEIAADDALRLEKEVAKDPMRREVYDQYCRIQKACSMLSEEMLESAAEDTHPRIAAFPQQRRWGLGSLVAGMAAAAACAAVVIVVRNNAALNAGLSVPAAGATSQLEPMAALTEPAASPVSMKPVFVVRLPSDQVSRGAERALFASADEPARAVELNWIGDIHMAPVFANAKSDFLLNPKTDLRASAITGTPDERESQEPSEMAAFRFQR